MCALPGVKMASIHTLTSLLFIALLSNVNGQCTVEKAQQFFKRSIYEFTTQLATRINQDTESHFVASGISAWTLISALSLGATEETLTEIAHVLKMHPHPCFNDRYFDIARRLTSTTNGTVLERSATLFIDTDVNPNEDFKYEVTRAGVCNIDVIPFSDSYSAANYINDFVSRATHEAIDEIVTSSDLDGARIVMIDALFFKGAWKIQFPYSDTEQSAFYNERGNQIGDVDLMFVTGTFNVASIRQIQARVLELPYGEENRFSMLIFLPNLDVSVTKVIHKLKLISLRTIFATYNILGQDNVAVQIPRFKITADVNLKEFLIDMGLRKMFDRYEAKFNDLCQDQVFVSNLIQKADIEVMEDGTIASGGSEAVFESRSMPDQFIANKPFVFMIVDRDTEIPLFVGAYTKPTTF